MLTQEKLHELLDYDPATGKFTWRIRVAMRVHAGDMAGHQHAKGYVNIKVMKRFYPAHRLAWFHVYGVWPPNEVDHINGVRSDNRIANLRLATESENQANRKLDRNNTSGVKGVTWNKSCKKWQAQIKVHRVTRYLGVFEDKASAAQAYKAAADASFGSFAKPIANLAPAGDK